MGTCIYCDMQLTPDSALPEKPTSFHSHTHFLVVSLSSDVTLLHHAPPMSLLLAQYIY
ncbi:hypothetical protein [Vibrio parahaemolyticus]|uniref:hypothetical protein n=1 Tax=Vibrio parahaemolyticus TaxID=670 RepID=UPI0015E01A6A|nr:hypothetical protein [Vibrio parahaemolyticus]